MKRFLKLSFVLFLAVAMLTSCQSKEERAIERYQSFCEELKANAENCTQGEYEEYREMYDQMQMETSDCEFTTQQLKVINKIDGEISGLFLKIKMRFVKDDFQEVIEGSESFMEGLGEAIEETND